MKKKILIYFIIALFAIGTIYAIINPEQDPTFTIDTIEYLTSTGDTSPNNDIFIVLTGTLSNPNDTQKCIRARNARLIINGEEYAPPNDVMDAIKEHHLPDTDFLGAYQGHCVDENTSEPSFVAFDVPAGAENVQFKFYDEITTISASWEIPTPTPTPTTGPSPTPTITLTSSNTPTPSNTPPPSDTPTPTATLTNEQLKEEIAHDIVENNIITEVVEIRYFELTNYLNVSWSFNWAGSIGYEERTMMDIVCDLKETEQFTNDRVFLGVWVDVVDSFGEESTIYGFKVELEADTIDQINCDNKYMVTLENIASIYDVHPVMDN